MKIHKGDRVLIISGKDRGKSGKVLDSYPELKKIMVEGVNLKKKHVRPKRQGAKGQVVQIAAPFSVSNTKLICPKCGKPARVGYQITENLPAGRQGKKYRICKKCNSEI